MNSFTCFAYDDDMFQLWSNQTEAHLSDAFWERFDTWVVSSCGLCNKWFNKLFDKGYEPAAAAALIERAFFLCKLEKTVA